MQFNPQALVATLTFVLLFVAALNGSAWGIAGTLAALVIQVATLFGGAGFWDFFLIVRRGRLHRR